MTGCPTCGWTAFSNSTRTTSAAKAPFSTRPGSPARPRSCTAATAGRSPRPRATFTSTGTVTSAANNLCLNVTGTGNTSAVTIATCNGQTTQRWTRS
ncbi:hypothetical protein DQ384_09695 [Sphaerisporangium album]|uniref:Ricin B lectin domain-containing protein n=1 Tax=Sphaerisporangium album TaxID=509200 RepID=A0A367FN22_9ACTN|nr:hypothetical protein DQ384_09695 [Sphaerisporangium album]